MSNMSYCRFHNTLQDLRDCYFNMEEDEIEELSSDEKECREDLIKLCVNITRKYGTIDKKFMEELIRNLEEK